MLREVLNIAAALLIMLAVAVAVDEYRRPDPGPLDQEITDLFHEFGMQP